MPKSEKREKGGEAASNDVERENPKGEASKKSKKWVQRGRRRVISWPSVGT